MSKTDDLMRERGLEFRIVTNEPDIMEKIYALRYQVFCEEMKVCTREQFPDGKDRDQYDDHSIHCALMRDDEVVAYCRLITYREGVPFPIEAYDPDLPSFEKTRAVEISKGLVPTKHRGTDVAWVCFNKTYEYCALNNILWILSFSNDFMYAGYIKRSVPLQYIGAPYQYKGHRSHPIIIHVQNPPEKDFY